MEVPHGSAPPWAGRCGAAGFQGCSLPPSLPARSSAGPGGSRAGSQHQECPSHAPSSPALSCLCLSSRRCPLRDLSLSALGRDPNIPHAGAILPDGHLVFNCPGGSAGCPVTLAGRGCQGCWLGACQCRALTRRACDTSPARGTECFAIK